MSALTTRAEHAVLGALLSDTRIESMPALDASDFDHPGHAEVFAAAIHHRSIDTDISSDALIDRVAAEVTAPGFDTARLHDLRDRCPQPAHVEAYAQLVQAQGFQRRVIAQAQHLTPGAQDAFTQTLHKHAEAYTAFHHTTADSPGPSNMTAERRAAQEEQVLAGLVQYPEQAVTLARTVPPEAFTSPQRRHVFESTVALAESGDAIDDVIISWELHKATAARQLATGTTSDHDPEPADTLLARIASQPITPTGALATAKQLAATTPSPGAAPPPAAGEPSTAAPDPAATPRPQPPSPPPPGPRPGNGSGGAA